MHARFAPKAHRFQYRIFYFALDLDEIDDLAARLTFFSVNRPNAYSFREADFLPTDQPGSTTLKERVVAFAAQHGVDLSGGRVQLVMLPRIFGYIFNPISLYFCFDRDGSPAAAIAEVTNTFREVKPYFLAADDEARTTGRFRVRTPKHFYVSPYSDVDVCFDFNLRFPGSALSVRIDDYCGRERTLATVLVGQRRELTSLRLAWFTLKYPLLTLRIIALIHWHAFLLWLKRVPWFAKRNRVEDQRDLFRPHRSLRPPRAA